MSENQMLTSSARIAALSVLSASLLWGVLAHGEELTSQPAETEDGQWLMPAKNYASTRYSQLDQITAENVSGLHEVWKFDTGILRGHEAAPVVVGARMYVVTPFPNVLYALDLAHSGAVLWKYEPKPVPAAQGVACCDVVNRGCAYADGRVFFNTLDGHTCAVNAETGQEVWKTKLCDIFKGETMTMAPLVAKGTVLAGNSGGEFGVRGWLVGMDAATGHIKWKAFSTGPDADVLIGPNFKPHYDQDKGKDLGVKTWPPGQWEIGGGTVWGWISYDPELNLIYYGTGNPGPWNAEVRPGDNKWTCGIFARNPDNGEARWFYQWSPHDLFDWDGVNESLLLEMPHNGQRRKVLMHAERNGYFYILDRQTGEVLSATPFSRITTTRGVDLKTGRLLHIDEKTPSSGKVIRDIAPVAAGAKDWQPCAFSPRTGWVYIPHQNMTMDLEAMEANYIAGTPYLGTNSRMYIGPGGMGGEICAWDPIAGKKAWKVEEKFPVWSGALATAGDLVFYGTMQGSFKALHARTGKLLWEVKTPSGIIGQPISYRGPDGKQYVAIFSGVGGWAGAVVSAALDTRDASGALGFVGAMSELPKHTKPGGTLHVYALP